MKIEHLRINHLENPMGYAIEKQSFSWIVTAASGKKPEAYRVVVTDCPESQTPLLDTGFRGDISPVSFETELALKPRHKYLWKVFAQNGRAVSESGWACFETGKCGEPWMAKWISAGDRQRTNPVFRKEFSVGGAVGCARAYICGLGLYELYVNGVHVNDGYLQPGFNNYSHWLQYQTLDLTEALQPGQNALAVMLGDGWYKGRFGVNGGFENNFGERFHLLCEIRISYVDGTEEIIGSDESFLTAEGPVAFANIYDGETYDSTVLPRSWMQPGFDDSAWSRAKCLAPEKAGKLTERYSLPVRIKAKRIPISLLTAADGSKILDVGQNITGWLTFPDMLEKGQSVTCQFAEHMQDGNICRDNLLTAKQEFHFTSDGSGCLVRPHFTYFGFRYVKLIGFPADIGPGTFTAWCLYSDMPDTGHVVTGNEKVNRLISNAFWSQRDNFLEHPTDCPQRAERLGWTGDAQMYCRTACYNMYMPAFYRKYMKDVNEEQAAKGGCVPFIVPKIAGRGFEESEEDECSAAWSDVAVIIPWNLYLFYGDRQLLAEQYEGMKQWISYMARKAAEAGQNCLWQSGFHFGDWLALDNPEPGPFGKTDKYFVASCYYYYSTLLTAKAAGVLGLAEDFESFQERAKKIRGAIRKEYFSEDGICKIDTQTAYVLTIYMDLVPETEQEKNAERLVEKIRANGNHLDTGFVGTPYLCPALSKAGFSGVAYDLLLQEEAPGWLYQVNSGATTIWEAWTALDQDGRLTGDMSLNHYTFGSIVEWIYSCVCGIRPIEEAPGFAAVLLAPEPDVRLKYASADYDSAVGRYHIGWKCGADGHGTAEITVPAGGRAHYIMKKSETDEWIGTGQYRYLF